MSVVYDFNRELVFPDPRSLRCPPPYCLRTSKLAELYPHPDPSQYYRCGFNPAKNNVESIIEPCPTQLLFSPESQTCIVYWHWKDPCGDEVLKKKSKSRIAIKPKSSTTLLSTTLNQSLFTKSS